MILLLGLLAMAMLLGWLAGGRISNLETARLRLDWLLAAGLLLLGAMPSVGRDLPAVGSRLTVAVWLLVALSGVAVCWLNRTVPWLWLVAFGLLANATVVAVNWGMPVLLANVPAGLLTRADAAVAASWLHQTVTSDTRALVLADVVPLTIGGITAGMASVGDLVLAIGASAVLFSLMLDDSRPS